MRAEYADMESGSARVNVGDTVTLWGRPWGDVIHVHARVDWFMVRVCYTIRLIDSWPRSSDSDEFSDDYKHTYTTCTVYRHAHT